MKLGLFHINMGPQCRPEVLASTAAEAEAAGFDLVWAGEHIVLPDPRVPPAPMDPQEPVLDPRSREAPPRPSSRRSPPSPPSE